MIKDLSESKIKKLLGSNCVGSLGFIAQKSPYVLPVTYYYDPEQNHIISHSMEGHKVGALREYPQVSLMVFEQDSITRWRSVLVHGIYEELRQIDAKFYLREFSEGVRKVLVAKEGSAARFIEEFSSKSEGEGVPLVYRIRITDWTGKFRDD